MGKLKSPQNKICRGKEILIHLMLKKNHLRIRLLEHILSTHISFNDARMIGAKDCEEIINPSLEKDAKTLDQIR
jgi:hypothetical protein